MGNIVDRRVLLYSGGLDSYALRYIYEFSRPNDKIIFFDTQTDDNRLEKQVLDKEVEIVYLPIRRFELENKIIPFRNFLFTLIAANFGNKIFLGSTLGDTTRDKDYVFKGMCDAVLNYFGSFGEKMPYQADRFEVCMPFKTMTKTEIVRGFLECTQTDRGMLRNSRSCYSDTLRECGKCRSCLRKYIAFKNNNIDYMLDFEPPTLTELSHFYTESVGKKRHPKELDEITMCIGGAKGKL